MKIKKNKIKDELKEFVTDYYINSFKRNDSISLTDENYLCYYLIFDFLEEKNFGEISQLIKKKTNYYSIKRSNEKNEFIKNMEIKINMKIDSNKTLFEKIIKILENHVLIQKKNKDVQTDNKKFFEFNLNEINNKIDKNQKSFLKNLNKDSSDLKNIMEENKILKEEIELIKNSNKNFETKQKFKDKYERELNYFKEKMKEEIKDLKYKNKTKLENMKNIYEKKSILIDAELKKNLNDQKKFNFEFKTLKESLKSKKRILEIEYKKKFEDLFTQNNLFEIEKNRFNYDKKHFDKNKLKNNNVEIKSDFSYWEKKLDKLKLEIIKLEKIKKKVEDENEIFADIKDNIEKENVILMKKNENLKLEVKEYELEHESKINIIKEIENNYNQIIAKNNKINKRNKNLTEVISTQKIEIENLVLDIVNYKQKIYNNEIILGDLKKKLAKKNKKVVLDEFLDKIDKKTSSIINDNGNLNKIDLLTRIKNLKQNRKKISK